LLSNRRKQGTPQAFATLTVDCKGVAMDADGEAKLDGMPDVPLVPAGAVGFLLYPWAVQLILANPPANDAGQKPRPD
jgi:hypothetical protein